MISDIFNSLMLTALQTSEYILIDIEMDDCNAMY